MSRRSPPLYCILTLIAMQGHQKDSKTKQKQCSTPSNMVVIIYYYITTHNVRTMAVDGKHGVGRAAEVLDVYQETGCDIIGIQETRRNGQSALLLAGYVVYCSGESGGEGEGKKGQGGVGLDVCKSCCCCCCCCFLTLTDPLRIQPWSQDRRNQTKSTGNRR